MKKWMTVATSSLIVVLAFFWYTQDDPNRASRDFYTKIAERTFDSKKGKLPKAERRPNDWFYVQRAYPAGNILTEARLDAAAKARADRTVADAKRGSVPTWSLIGPTNIPGRITDIAVHPSEPNTIYAASAAGGVFKTTNLGDDWSSVFDETGTESVGAIAIHPVNPDIIYVGTGEANAGGDAYEGTGVYKSTDAGGTWTHVGLPNSFHIGRILIDPLRPDSVYVAVAGKLFGNNPERGLYRSPDGGLTWEQLLYVSDSTACIDVAIHPSTGTIFAGMWERFRSPDNRKVGGMTTGLYRSSDLGETWSLLSNGLPPQSPTLGRVGVSVDPESETVWAVFFDHPGHVVGIYRSMDLGDSWISTGLTGMTHFGDGFGWWFGQIRAVPGAPMVAYALGVYLYKTVDGGNTWIEDVSWGAHVDHHALYILPGDTARIYDGSDGGVAYSADGGYNWWRLGGMANTQFYAITVNPLDATQFYGGTQDNGTLRSPGGLDDWWMMRGGDGFYTIVDYADTSVIYVETQWGGLKRSDNSGYTFINTMTGLDYQNNRHNWNTPVVMDPTYHTILYYGSSRLYKTEDRADNWFPISGDLTNGPGPAALTFGTITTIAVAATDSQVVYVGTDDANVWVTQNGGGTWTSINATLPDRWVTRVAVDPYDAGIAYATFSGYRVSSWTSHIYRTTDYGATWDDIHGNLMDAPINDVIVDPDADSTLYIATDFGVYYTIDLGQTWAPLGTGMPIVPVHDIVLHPGARRLGAGTHGRSIFVISVDCEATVPCRCYCPNQGDFDEDGFLTSIDVASMIDVVFFGGSDPIDPDCNSTRGDISCDGFSDSVDLALLIDHVFFGGAGPCDPCGT